ncbi:MAG: DNA-processing protein DprA [Patescibacteria group bacterium]
MFFESFSYSVISKTDVNYPECFKYIKNAPEKVFVAGKLIERDFEGVAVIGSRLMSSYGRDAIKSIVSDLASSGITIVSGLAFGVDVYSQETALELGARTVAFMSSGLNLISPKSNFLVAKRIVESDLGAVISSYEPNFQAQKYTFIYRDHLLAAFCKAVLVIEAGQSSGTHHTVDAALAIGKDVFAVPGSIFSEVSAGCNYYIKHGAHPATSAQDILDIVKFSFLLRDKNMHAGKKGGLSKSVSWEVLRKSLTGFELEVFGKVLVEGVSVEELAQVLLQPVVRIMQAVSILEVHGFVVVEGNVIKRLVNVLD